MDKKKKVLIILLVFVLLFGGASVLYKQLGKMQMQTSCPLKRMLLLRNRMIKTKQRMKGRWRLI